MKGHFFLLHGMAVNSGKIPLLEFLPHLTINGFEKVKTKQILKTSYETGALI